MEPVSSGELKNRYFVMRHRESEANVLKIIISDPAHGVRSYGLSAAGRRQVAASLRQCTILRSDTVMYCSDFKRTRETAAIVRRHLGISTVHISQRLRERDFGSWEKTSAKNYQKVWQRDAIDAEHTEHHVEAVSHVLQRGLALISLLERRYANRDILLVGHGDPLQILETAFHGLLPSRHRSQKNLEVAEVRPLVPNPLATLMP